MSMLETDSVGQLKDSMATCFDQLSFGPNQQQLTEVEPIPLQMSLLPDPAPWELDPGPPPGRREGAAQGPGGAEPGRGGAEDPSLTISEGQESLF